MKEAISGPGAKSGACTIALKRGSLWFTREDHQRFLAGVDSVVLLREGSALFILPILQAAAGGYLLKQRNLAGDRVAHAAGFFREQGYDDEQDASLSAEWREERGGLCVAHFFPAT